MILSQIDALLIGTPKPFRADGTLSAMARAPVEGPIYLGQQGFVGDQVADTNVHGGPDKAVHFYPSEHYPKWIAHFAGEGFAHPLLDQAGAFGENISASGLTEDSVRIGDRFRIGRALVEVAQGRQPCWKLDHHFAVHGLSGAVISSGRCGGYFRVLEGGEVARSDIIQQVHQPQHEWTISRTFKLLIGGGHRAAGAQEQLRELAALETLAENWRNRAAKLAK